MVCRVQGLELSLSKVYGIGNLVLGVRVQSSKLVTLLHKVRGTHPQLWSEESKNAFPAVLFPRKGVSLGYVGRNCNLKDQKDLNAPGLTKLVRPNRLRQS